MLFIFICLYDVLYYFRVMLNENMSYCISCDAVIYDVFTELRLAFTPFGLEFFDKWAEKIIQILWADVFLI